MNNNPQKTYIETYQPTANAQAIVRFGNARFTILTSELIRMEWADDHSFEDRASLIFVNRDLEVPSYKLIESDDGIRICTDKLTLSYYPRGAGRFDDSNLNVAFLMNENKVVWTPNMPGVGNLGGTTRSLDYWLGSKTLQPEKGRENVANFEPIEPGLLSRDGWTVIDDSTGYLFDNADFSFKEGLNSPWPWVVPRSKCDQQDLYLFAYGHDYKRLLGDFIKVAGRIALPPKFILGTWWSRYTTYRDQELKHLINEYRSKKVPLDVLVLDLEWHKAYIEKWLNGETDLSGRGIGFGGFSWNRLLYPEPKKFVEEMHKKGIKVTLNLHPAHGIQPTEDRYADMARHMGLDPNEGKYIPLDIVDKRFTEGYMKYMHHPVTDDGIDFWWNDHIDGDNSTLDGLKNIWWMNYVFFSDMARRGKRPMIFERWGGLGSHRYPIQFSGDMFTSWESLHYQVSFTARSANVGAAYWSHDLGGHYPGVCEPELYTRWIQFGALSPVMRPHTCKDPNAERLIWAYPQPYADIMRKAFHQRYALIPYLYTEARRTYDTGVAFLHPLYIDWPEADDAYAYPNEYALGGNLITSPITQPLDPKRCVSEQTMWIPDGDWYELASGRYLRGPTTLTQGYLLRETPILQRAGSIVPLQPPMDYTGQRNVDPLGIRIAPARDEGSSTYTLYEDDGNNRDYALGASACTTINHTWKHGDMQITIHPAEGMYDGMAQNRAYEIILLGDWPPSEVTVNAKYIRNTNANEIGWWYDGRTLSTHILTDSFAVSDAVEIMVKRAPSTAEQYTELSGIVGALARLEEVYALLKRTWPVGFCDDSLIDVVQTGRRIELYPERSLEEVLHLHKVIDKAVYDVQRQDVTSKRKQSNLAKRMQKPLESQEVQEKISAVNILLAQARAVINEAKHMLSAK